MKLSHTVERKYLPTEPHTHTHSRMGNNASLHESCRLGDLTAVTELLKSAETAEVEKLDEFGRTPLLLAAGSAPASAMPSPPGRTSAEAEVTPIVVVDNKKIVVDMINLLVSKQANLDHQDEKGWTALHYACQAQNHDAVACLLQHGAVPVRDALGLLPQVRNTSSVPSSMYCVVFGIVDMTAAATYVLSRVVLYIVRVSYLSSSIIVSRVMRYTIS
jgi:hypothetical protein